MNTLWRDTTSQAYTHWATGEPNEATTHKCAAIKTDTFWEDKVCTAGATGVANDDNAYYVCEDETPAIAPNEDVAFSGTSDEAFDLGQQFLALPVTRPFTGLVPSMVFAVRFSEPGEGVAGLVLEGDGAMESVGIGFDQSFGMVLAGSFQQTLGFLSGPIDSAGGWDVFVAREL